MPSDSFTHEVTPEVREDAIGFHEVLLALLEPEDREAFRRVGKKLYELALEHRPCVQPCEPAPGAESPLYQEVAAATTDLVTVRDVIWQLGRTIEDSALDSSDARLSLLCQDVAEPLDEVIDKLQDALE